MVQVGVNVDLIAIHVPVIGTVSASAMPTPLTALARRRGRADARGTCGGVIQAPSMAPVASQLEKDRGTRSQ